MPHRDLVVAGASAGGVEALRDLMRDLPADLPAAMLVVLHMPSSAFSALPAILNRAGSLKVLAAEDGGPLEPGFVLVAPPDRHLLVRGDEVALGGGPKENGHRPAVDPLFRSAARWRGPRVIGVVLSGTLDDGAAGAWSICARGGAVVVQDPEHALYDGMPRAALRAVPRARRAWGAGLADAIVELCTEEIDGERQPAEERLVVETEIAQLGEAGFGAGRPGRPAAITCPDCNGAMFQIEEGSVVRFRCRVGHAWSPESLLVQQVESAESALWAAIRALEEKGALHRRLASDAADQHRNVGGAYHLERAGECEQAAAVLREMLRSRLAGDRHESAVSLD